MDAPEPGYPSSHCVVSRARLRFSGQFQDLDYWEPQTSTIGHRTDASENPGGLGEAPPVRFSRMNLFSSKRNREEASYFVGMASTSSIGRMSEFCLGCGRAKCGRDGVFRESPWISPFRCRNAAEGVPYSLCHGPPASRTLTSSGRISRLTRRRRRTPGSRRSWRGLHGSSSCRAGGVRKRMASNDRRSSIPRWHARKST